MIMKNKIQYTMYAYSTRTLNHSLFLNVTYLIVRYKIQYTKCVYCVFKQQLLTVSRVNPQHGQARPRTLLVNCKHIFEQNKQPSYVSVLVLLLSLRYYISLWNPICS